MLSGGPQCIKCANGNPCNMCSSCDARPLLALADYKFSSDILIIKPNRKNLKSPTHFCKMCGYGDFSSTRVRRHLMLRHQLGSKTLESAIEKPAVLADCLSQTNRNSDSEPESPLSQKMCEDQDLPEDLSVHSDHSASDNDENVQVVPQFKPVSTTKVDNKRMVIVRPAKKSATKRSAPQATSILKRRLLGEQVVDEMEASEAALNSNELNVKMVYQNSKFVIDKSEAFWLKGYNLPARYQLAQ